MEPVWLMLFRLHRVTQNRGAKNKPSAPLTPAELISHLFSGKLNFTLQIAFQQLPWPSGISSMTCYYMFLTLFPVFSVRDFWQTWQACSQMDQSFISMESKYFVQAQICAFHTLTSFYISFCPLEILLGLSSEAYRNWQFIWESSLVL